MVDHTVLCFGFVTKTVSTTHWCFSYWWTALAQQQGILCFSCCPDSEEAGSAQNLWGDTARAADCTDQRMIHAILCSKGWGKEGGNYSVYLLSCWCEWIPYFTLPLSVPLLYLLNCLNLSLQIFSLLPFTFPTLSHWEGRGRAAYWVNPQGLKVFSLKEAAYQKSEDLL